MLKKHPLAPFLPKVTQNLQDTPLFNRFYESGLKKMA